MEKTRKTIDDKDVSLVFVNECECKGECGTIKEEFSPGWIAENGIPICPVCGTDFWYDHTEIYS